MENNHTNNIVCRFAIFRSSFHLQQADKKGDESADEYVSKQNGVTLCSNDIIEIKIKR